MQDAPPVSFPGRRDRVQGAGIQGAGLGDGIFGIARLEVVLRKLVVPKDEAQFPVGIIVGRDRGRLRAGGDGGSWRRLEQPGGAAIQQDSSRTGTGKFKKVST